MGNRYSIHTDNSKIIEGCKANNRLAQKALYEKYYNPFLGICMRYGKDQEEAMDILNTAFLKIMTKISMYKPSGSFEAWMKRIIYTTAIDHIRKNTRYNKAMDYNSIAESSIGNGALEELLAEDLYKLIQKLPDSSRAVFNLYVIEGYKHAEIGELLGITEGTSKWHLSKAKKELRAAILKLNKTEYIYE